MAHEKLLPAGSDDKWEGVKPGSIGALGRNTTEKLITRTAEKQHKVEEFKVLWVNDCPGGVAVWNPEMIVIVLLVLCVFQKMVLAVSSVPRWQAGLTAPASQGSRWWQMDACVKVRSAASSCHGTVGSNWSYSQCSCVSLKLSPSSRVCTR